MFVDKVLKHDTTGQRFTDTTSGFQAVNRATAGFLARHLPMDYNDMSCLLHQSVQGNGAYPEPLVYEDLLNMRIVNKRH